MSFKIMVNGGKSESFTPSKRRRQGDLLSCYLFILRQEVLSRLLDWELRSMNINSIKAISQGLTISHVMYVDDIVLFLKATSKDAPNLNKLLEKYYKWSGQSINKDKSGVFFSKHTHHPHRRSIKSILLIKTLKNDVVYLGAPLFLSRSPSFDFSYCWFLDPLIHNWFNLGN